MAAPSQPEEEESALEEGEGRFLYFNSSSTATSLTLLGALILLGVIFYLVYAGGIFGASAGNRNDQYYTNQGYDDGQYYTGRSAGSSIDFSNLNVIQWIS